MSAVLLDRKKKIIPNGSLVIPTIKESEELEIWIKDIASQIEQNKFLKAVVTIQNAVRTYLVKAMMKSRLDKSKYNIRAKNQLQKILSILEKNPEEHEKFFLRNLIQHYKGDVEDFPFWQDEFNRISYYEYTGIISQQPPYSWFVVYRDLFFITENAVEIIPTFWSEFPNITIRIINNDTLEELPRIFNTYIHQEYIKNEYGYTMFIYGTSRNAPIAEYKWRLGLITSPVTSFIPMKKDHPLGPLITKEILDYYFPTKDSVVARFYFQSTEECILSFYWSVSSTDIPLYITIFEEEEEILSVEGISKILIPVFFLRKHEANDSNSTLTFKYYLELKVDGNRWLIHPQHSAFIQSLQRKAKLEYNIFVENNEVETDVEISVKSQIIRENSGPINKKELTRSSLNSNFPHWSLKIITESSNMELLEIGKDMSKLQRIKEIKHAWEEAKPGCLAEAHLIRKKFLQNFQLESSDESISTDELDITSIKSQMMTVSSRTKLSKSSSEEMEPMILKPLQTKTLLKPFQRIPQIPIEGVKPVKTQQIKRFAESKIQLHKKHLTEKIFIFNTVEYTQMEKEESRKKAMASREEFRKRMILEENNRKAELIAAMENLRLSEESKKSVKAKK